MSFRSPGTVWGCTEAPPWNGAVIGVPGCALEGAGRCPSSRDAAAPDWVEDGSVVCI